MSEDDVPSILLIIAMAAIACLTPPQNDTWWHLRSGQQMWQTGSWLVTEPFSHTAQGAPLHNHEWLTQIVFYGLYRMGGSVLLTLFAGACGFVAVLASWRLFRGSTELRLLLLVALLVTTPPEWAVRPQVISLALLMLCVHLATRDRLVWLPLVCWAWANAHGMVLFGIAVAGIAAIEALVWSRDRLRRDLIAAIGCVVAPMLTPLGWHYWPRVFQTISTSRVIELQEYRPPFETIHAPFWALGVALLVLVVVARRTLHQHARGDRILIGTAAVLAAASVLSARNIPFFVLVAAPAISRLVTERPRRVSTRAPSWAAYAMITAGALIAAAIVTLKWADGGATLGWQPFSANAIAAIRRCPEPIFNGLTEGGPLMWFVPERRVFVDSRVEAYPAELLLQSRAADLHGEYEAAFRQYGVRCAVTPARSPMARALARDSRMNVLFSDSMWVLFEQTPRDAESRVAQGRGRPADPDRQQQ